MTQKYLLTAPDGSIRGFMSDEVHHEIPPDAVRITDEVWRECLDNPGARRWVDGALVVVEGAGASPLEARRQEKAEELAAAYAAAIARGMPWRGKALQIDDGSTAMMTAAVAMADRDALPSPFAWRTADNSFRPMDAAEVVAMAVAAGRYVYALKGTAWLMTDAVVAARTEAEIAAVDVGRWPEPAAWVAPEPAPAPAAEPGEQAGTDTPVPSAETPPP